MIFLKLVSFLKRVRQCVWRKEGGGGDRDRERARGERERERGGEREREREREREERERDDSSSLTPLCLDSKACTAIVKLVTYRAPFHLERIVLIRAKKGKIVRFRYKN